jgi:hypothetical protein
MSDALRRVGGTKLTRAGLLLAASMTAAGLARADSVTDWNHFADSLPMGPPPIEARIMAMTQIAVHDALNSIEPVYSTYTEVAPAAAGASPDAAVASAARRVLDATVPSQAAATLAFYNGQIGACASQACLDGVAAGEAAANAILLRRNGDGSATPHLPYNLLPAPGVHQPTPPTPPASAASPAVQFAGWAHVLPFVLNSGSQFRADPVEFLDVTSDAYTRDYNEVKRVGELNAEANGDRTADQSGVARFWPGGGANWNAVTRLIVSFRGLDRWEHARLFALSNMAQSDAAVAVYDTKFTYTFWRPVTAIRAAATDGNPNTAPNATWLSYQNTPPYPDYTCGLTTVAGAATEVLRRYFGTDEVGYTMTAVGVTRTFATLSEATADAVDARVFGGMHFRTGCVQGVRHGSQVGRFVIQHALKPANPGNAASDQ